MAATRRLARLQGHLAGRAAVSPTGSAAQGAESIKLVVADGFFAPQAELYPYLNYSDCGTAAESQTEISISNLFRKYDTHPDWCV